MFRNFRLKTAMILMIAAFGLAACESEEEKAKRHFETGMELLAAGDEDRALIAFRNVFEHDGFHKEAREIYAATLLERGEIGEAISQYLRLIEQYPDALDARITLTETSVLIGDWAEAKRHGLAAIELAPDDPQVKAIDIALKYKDAIIARDTDQLDTLADQANQMIESGLDSIPLTMLAVDHLAQTDKPLDAIPLIDAALENDPEVFELHLRKYSLLSDSNDIAAIGAQLQRMADLFPEREEINDQLIDWYLAQNDLDAAEAFLRQLTQRETASLDDQSELVEFLLGKRGADAAISELDALIKASDDPVARARYNRLYAAVEFEQGKVEQSINRLRDLISSEDAGPTERTEAQVLLAQIHASQGDIASVRRLIEEVLSIDPNNTDALKMRANWFIDDGRIGAAIVDLRAALNQSPRDITTLTLMAIAHERDGNMELASERLALAVEISGEAAPESLRYAQFLMENRRLGVASTVLRAALRKAPEDIEVLTTLGEIYLQEQDWARAQDITRRLRGLETAEAQRRAQFLQAAILSGQDRIEESLSFLQSQIQTDASRQDDMRTAVLIVQNLVRSGRLESALSFVKEQIDEAPDNLELRLLQGNLFALNGELDAAESTYRSLIQDAPTADVPVRLLITVLYATDRADEARALLDTSLTRIPESAMLNWLKASLLEQSRDLKGAADIYEKLYALDNANILIANNLASLLVAQDQTEETVERAFRVARRLREEPVPQFQDTYGWIMHLRGDPGAALPHLEAAFAGLPDNAEVNYHLGVVYVALGRINDGRTRLQTAVDLFGQDTSQMAEQAREKLKQLP